MKLVICHGETSVEHMVFLLEPGGLKRPYRVCTMDYLWREVAVSQGVPVYFFTDKLRMMQFVLKYQGSDRPVAVVVKDGTDESRSMAASFHAMNAVDFSVNQT